MLVLTVNVLPLEDDDDDSTNIEDVHLSNVESHVIIGYNKDEDEDYRHMRFHLILLSCFFSKDVI